MPLTTDALVPMSSTLKQDAYGNKWIEFTRTSDQYCNETSVYSFTSEIQCNLSVSLPRLVSVDQSSCDVKTVLVHSSGCPVGQVLNFNQFMHD